MVRHRFGGLAHAEPAQASPNFDRSPIISADEQQFLAGKIGPNEYLRRGQEAAEQWVRTEERMEKRGSTRRLLHLFAASASALYMALASIFFITDSRTAALAAALVSLSFMAAITLYKAIRRVL